MIRRRLVELFEDYEGDEVALIGVTVLVLGGLGVVVYVALVQSFGWLWPTIGYGCVYAAARFLRSCWQESQL